MPSLSRPAIRTHTIFYVLPLLAIFCANPSAAEPLTFALLRPHSIFPIVAPFTQIRQCSSQERTSCRRTRDGCIRILRESGRTHECLAAYRECIEDCRRGD
jgi:hypothetical protein